jgi:phosphoenolpyruvate carboxykinase (ATP)
MYHFLSGYTAKVAGTECGIKEPVPNFSSCFGAAFTLHPIRYSDLLREKLEKHGSSAYLVNSGWTGGPYGTGEHMFIHTTRTCVDAILDGLIKDAEFHTDPVFGFEVPVTFLEWNKSFWILAVRGLIQLTMMKQKRSWQACMSTFLKSMKE